MPIKKVRNDPRVIRKLTLPEFRDYLRAAAVPLAVERPYAIEPCKCGDTNCKGWRLVGTLVVLAWLLASPASAQTPIRDFLYRSSQVAAIAANGADGYSTEFALARGAFHETNPAILRVSNSPAWFGAFHMGAAALQLWLTSRIPNHTVATIANAGIAGFFGAVAWHNSRVIARVERSNAR